MTVGQESRADPGEPGGVASGEDDQVEREHSGGVTGGMSGFTGPVVSIYGMPSPVLAPFEFVAGHIVATIDGRRVIVDTGSPVTFGRGDHIRLGNGTHSIASGVLGFTVETAAEHIRRLPGVAPDFGVDVLLGTDLLWGHRLVLDFPSRTLGIAPVTPMEGAFPCSSRARFLVEDLHVDGSPLLALVDTGAPVSYLSNQHTDGIPVSGWARDFFHGGGDFQVPLRIVPVRFRDREVEVGFAEPPVSVWMAMRLLGVQAIVGTDVLELLGSVTLDLAG